MKIVQINMLHYGSTGKIMLGIAEIARAKGHEVYTFSPRFYQRHGKASFHEIAGHTFFGTSFENMLHYYAAKISGFNGMFSWIGTLELLNELKQIKPDIIHLHNIHNRTICLPMLFDFIKRENIRTIWTLHDCWAFTGQCAHFSMARCQKWKTGCFHCPQVDVYPDSLIDMTRVMWRWKKNLFTGIQDMTVVTPSLWLADLVKQSYLRESQVVCIRNGINLNVFQPTASNFRRVHDLEHKKILLGVSFGWGEKKGLDVFIELAKRLDDTYKIILVGTNDAVDRMLPCEILSIHQTNNPRELAKIYSAADLFINPTREETYPTVNMEAIACGTPVLTFRTGGSPEMLTDSTGTVVDCDDIDGMEREIHRICETRPFKREDCVMASQAFDMRSRFEEYVQIYEKGH